MARYKTLLSLLQDLRAALGMSGNPANNTATREVHIRALQGAQEWLWERYDWPHLRVRRLIDLQAGQRYYDPSGARNEAGAPMGDINLERLEAVQVRDGSEWRDLTPRIDVRHYATWDSDLDQRSWPVECWDIHEDEDIEIWPVPADGANVTDLEGTLRLIGIRDLRPLVADGDVCDLDDKLIVGFVAAEALARSGAKDAQLVLDKAKDRERSLAGNFTKTKSFQLFGGSTGGKKLHGPPRVHYRTNEV